MLCVGNHLLKKSSDAELWCLKSKQYVEYAVELLVVYDAINPVCHQCNIALQCTDNRCFDEGIIIVARNIIPEYIRMAILKLS